MDLRYIQNRVSHALLSASAASIPDNNSWGSKRKRRKKKMSKEEKMRMQRMRNEG